MSDCPDDETLTAYLEHRTPHTCVEAVEAHLDACAACRVVVARVAAVAAAVEAAGPNGTLLLDAPVRRPTQPARPIPRGARLDRYVVEGELGRGGMGVVLAAHDPELDRRVALKLVRPGDDDANGRSRLLREARAMAKLAHPNVVAVYDAGALPDGRVFLAMEYVPGRTLRAALDGAPLDRVVRRGRGRGRRLPERRRRNAPRRRGLDRRVRSGLTSYASGRTTARERGAFAPRPSKAEPTCRAELPRGTLRSCLRGRIARKDSMTRSRISMPKASPRTPSSSARSRSRRASILLDQQPRRHRPDDGR